MRTATVLWAAIALVSYAGAAAPVCGQLSSVPPLPWPETKPITLSFAPDFVEIGRYRSELFMHLDDQLSSPEWQVEMLRAFQNWSRYADLQFALVPDSNRAFGIPALGQSDPRFGDIRLGAFPQAYVLGNAVFYHPSAGAWAGDIFLDTNRSFYIHDWSQGGQSPPDQYDLYSVLLHEIGNALGLEDELLDPSSVMFFSYTVPRGQPNLDDIARLQDLYGPPSPDPYEPVGGNETFETATIIEFPRNFSRTLIAAMSGRIQAGDDVDVYRFYPTELSENCWLKLRTKGRSLFCGRMTAFDHEFQEIATIECESPLQNNLIKEITNLDASLPVYVVVEWAGVPDFDFGEYELVLDFNENGGEEGEEGDDDDPDERFFEAGDELLTDVLYGLNGLVDLETNANNTFNNAVRLYSPLGLTAGSRFEFISAIASAADQDMYRIVTSAGATGPMVIDLAPLGLDPASWTVMVFNSQKKQVSVRRRFRTTGELSVEFTQAQPNSTYYIRVQNKVGQSIAGNYLLQINVADGSSPLNEIETALLTAGQPEQFGSFTTYKTQLFRFDLSQTSPNKNTQAAQLTIYSDSGRVELVTSVRSGRTTVAYVWLQAGEHYFRMTAKSKGAAAILNSSVVLAGASLSDDEGPVLIDPSGNPVSGPQGPGGGPTPPPTWDFPLTHPWLWELVVPPENPWF